MGRQLSTRTRQRHDARRPAARSLGSRVRSPLVAALLIVGAGLFAYSNSFGGVLVFDDIASIVSNPHIRCLWPLSQSMSAPRDVTVAGRPVPSLTLALNYALAPADAREVFKPAGPDGPPEDDARFYRNVWGYHALNLAIHLLAALVLFGVARRSVMRAAGAADLAAPFAFAVALVWVVHPLHTESVTYVVQRVESLMALFYLLTLYGAIRAAEPGRTRAWWTALAIAACALGMASKEAMVSAPMAVALWDWTFRASDRPRWRLYAGLGSTWVILAALAATHPRAHSAGFGVGGWTWWMWLETQAGVVAHYLRRAVVPHPLVFDYEWSRAASFAAVAPQALLLAGLLALTVYALVRRRPLGFAGAWFFLILAPTSSVLPIPTQVAAEHRMYLPVAAVIVVAAAAMVKAASLAGARRHDARAFGAASVVVVACIVAVVLGRITYARNLDYQSDEALMRDTVDKRPLNVRARVAYGADLIARRRFAEAEAQLVVAARLEGSDKAHAQANMYLGSALCAQGRTAEGIVHLQQALGLDATLADAHALLGEAYDRSGESALALRHFTLALDGLPEDAAVLRRAAWLLATSSDASIRDGRRALELADRAVRISARHDMLALEALMAAYAEQGRSMEAAAAGREALAIAQASGNGLFVNALRNEIVLCEGGGRLREK